MKTGTAVLILRTGYFLSLLLMPAVHARAQMRVVAVADSHGAYPDLVAILERAGLIDGNRQWIGSASVLVQTGDVIARGNGEPQVLVGPAGGATTPASSQDKSGGKPEP
jgi:hypothetical protein